MDDSKKDKEKLSIPIYFKSSKDLYIGKGSFKNNKSSFKFTNVEPPTTTNTSSKYYVKEFALISRDKLKKDIIYKGREAPQDSNYILMKYNSDNRSLQICPANKWINFFQSFNYNQEKKEDKELQKKKEMKEKYKNFKEIFNFDYIDDMKKDKKEKKNTRKKKTLLPTSNDEDEDDDSLSKKKKKNYDFKDDSHSSELSLDLKEDSFESEEERRKEEKKMREEEEKRKKEEEKRKIKEKEKNQSDKDEFDEYDDYDDKSFEDVPSDVDENEEDNNEIFDFLSKKRNREKYPYDNMKEELVNLLRKKNKRTYEEIMIELIKKFNKELVEQYIEQLLDENTSKFFEGNESYYFLK